MDPQSLGTDPKTGLPVYVLTGRFGPYVQLGEAPEKGSKEKPRRASLTKNDQPDSITLDRALELLSLPRLVGHDAETGQDIIANFGRFGPYVKRGDEFRSLGSDADVFGVTLDQAIELFKQEKKGRRRTAYAHRASRGRPASRVEGEDRDPRGALRTVRHRRHHERLCPEGRARRCAHPRGVGRPSEGARRRTVQEGAGTRAGAWCGPHRRRRHGSQAARQAIGVTPGTPVVTIIGGGLAGCEAAWQVASRGVRVRLHEMRPVRPTLVHQGDRLAELVCSNSFRGDKLDNAVGVLKEEMRRLGSIIMRCADATRVPAGAALAVDRGRFADAVTAAIGSAPAHRGRARGDHGDSRSRIDRRPGHRGNRPAHVGHAVAGHRPLRRRRTPLLLRRHQPHRPRRFDRSVDRVPCLAVGKESGMSVEQARRLRRSEPRG